MPSASSASSTARWQTAPSPRPSAPSRTMSIPLGPSRAGPGPTTRFRLPLLLPPRSARREAPRLARRRLAPWQLAAEAARVVRRRAGRGAGQQGAHGPADARSRPRRRLPRRRAGADRRRPTAVAQALFGGRRIAQDSGAEQADQGPRADGPPAGERRTDLG